MPKLEESLLYQEIHELPQVLARLLQSESHVAQTLAAQVQECGIGHVVIAAQGHQ